jgi:type III pantothenate kinase
MTPVLVVDVGNSRIKWGRCLDRRIAECASLAPADAGSWQRTLEQWGLSGRLTWAVSGVQPARQQGLIEWLRRRGDEVTVLTSAQQLPLRVALDAPDRVGIDRLLDAVAAVHRIGPGGAAVIVDAGTAVTVDCVDRSGAFCGGAILPGFRLMAQALHEHTALLPLIDIRRAQPPLPGDCTPAAMEAGIYWAVAGGVQALVRGFSANHSGSGSTRVFLTGGDGPLLAPALEGEIISWPEMTLEGIRISAEALS